MKQPDYKAKKELMGVMENTATIIPIAGTKRKVKIRGIKPYTLERLTLLWQSRPPEVPKDSANTLKSMCQEPYFNIKQAVLFVLNDYWKIRLFYKPMCWLWGKCYGYTEEQMNPIIAEGKKKLPLSPHWMNMALSQDMRVDWMKQTSAEAEAYRQELLRAASQLSSKTFPNTEGQGGSSSE